MKNEKQQRSIALITGASRGIGAATATLMASQGWHIIVNFHKNQQAADAVVTAITQLGGSATAIQADLRHESDIVQLFQRIDELDGELTALVNNVGILEQKMPLVEMTADRINRVLQANVTSAFICCREAVKRMSTTSEGKGGSIVNVSSVASRLGAAFEYVDYAASKGAMDSLTLGLSKEVAAEGIRVNAVRPGLIYTDIHASGGEPGRVDRLAKQLPMKRGGQPEEVAQAIAWLSSDSASFVTGSFIDLAGGL